MWNAACPYFVLYVVDPLGPSPKFGQDIFSVETVPETPLGIEALRKSVQTQLKVAQPVHVLNWFCLDKAAVSGAYAYWTILFTPPTALSYYVLRTPLPVDSVEGVKEALEYFRVQSLYLFSLRPLRLDEERLEGTTLQTISLTPSQN